MAERKLTEKQKRFCQEYIVDLNGTQAAIRAGYAANSAEVTASRLLRNDKVKEYTQQLMDKRSNKLEITAEDVLQSILDIRANCTQTLDIKQKNESGEVEVVGKQMLDISGALKANELLGKHIKLFTDKVEHSGSMDINTKSKLIDKYLKGD